MTYVPTTYKQQIKNYIYDSWFGLIQVVVVVV